MATDRDAPAAAARRHPRASAPTAPSRVVPNAEIVEAIDSSDEWIQQRSGIKQRRWADARRDRPDDVASPRPARRSSGPGSTPDQIDCVIVATVTHLLQTPAVATAIADELGTDQAAAFDISAACAGFCHGIAHGVRHGPRRAAPGTCW